MDQIVIKSRFCGPSNSGNGGYTCGLLGGYIGKAAEVTLWQPPPLDTPLTVERNEDQTVSLWYHGNAKQLVGEAAPAKLDLDIPTAPTYTEAELAVKQYAGFQRHPFPDCFVCGTNRKHGDGLCIFAGPVDGRSMVAAPWIPDASLADSSGDIKPEFLWAALDCPGAFATLAWAEGVRPALLGRFTAEVIGSIKQGERCIVIGWPLSREGRKHFTATALFRESGERIAAAKAIWIEPKS